MGLPTTANYIVVASLMAPVVVSLAATNGLIVPLIAVHMFVFYFGILADDTPPVGLAAFAAAAIAKSDPIKTGIQGFMYDIRTAILPFLFIFNTQLLMIGIGNWFELLLVIASATIAMLLFAAATQGYWLTRSRLWESLLLLLIAFTLFRPGFWWDMVYSPVNIMPPTSIVELAEEVPPEGNLQLMATGENLDGKRVSRTVLLPMGPAGPGKERLANAGIVEYRVEGERVIIDMVGFSSQAQEAGLDMDWEILNVQVTAERPPKQIMFIPALVLLWFLALVQRKRHRPDPVPEAA
jgi:hypothetical protein